MSSVPLERREFLKLSVAASGGLLLGFHLPGIPDLLYAQGMPKGFMPNAFVRIGTDERITVIVNHSEMGQGVYTALPMMLADELDADWKTVGFEAAPVDAKYNHPVFGMQMTGGSTSIWSSFDQYRKAGAAARAMLVSAAANEWKVPAAECRTQDGKVVHSSGKEITFGKLAQAAAQLQPPAEAKLKDPKDFKLIGKPIKRLDTPGKLDGSAIFGIDVKLPNMLTAVVARPPVFGAKLTSVDDAAARRVPGVRKVVRVPSGVAVLADGFWQAKLGRDALKTTWDEGAMGSFSTKTQFEEYARLAKEPGLVARDGGKAEEMLAAAGKKIEAVYEVPYLSHAMMEPLNCVVDLRKDSCEVWTGTQFQTMDRAAAAQVAGLPAEKVQIHTTLLGGGFGRRANPASDFVREAVAVAKEAGVPVKVIWTREDDMHGGFYRPAYYHSFAGSVGADGKPEAWMHHIVGQSIMGGTPFEAMIKGGIDGTSVEGAADLHYAIPNMGVRLHTTKVGVPVLWWRSVGHSHTAFVTESFLDELAVLGKQEPYQLRKSLLAKAPRLLGVLNLAAEKAGWGRPLPKGHGLGIAAHESFGSYSAQVAEVSVENGKVRVHRFVCAIDCGIYVNPGIIEAQAQSGVIYGMSAALYGELTFETGRIQQRNFHDYPQVRINECPKIEVHVVKNNEKSGGVGEPGVPCVAPAITNAIFAATGKRIRKLPIRMAEAVSAEGRHA